jgi:hypothetical protein
LTTVVCIFFFSRRSVGAYGFVKDGFDAVLCKNPETCQEKPFTPETMEDDPMAISAAEDLFCAGLSSAIYRMDPSIGEGS